MTVGELKKVLDGVDDDQMVMFEEHEHWSTWWKHIKVREIDDHTQGKMVIIELENRDDH